MDYTDYNARKNRIYGDIWTNTGKCVFCDLREKYIITSNEKAVLTVNLFPYVDGHLLVVPKRHAEDFLEITPEEWNQMRELAQKGIELLRKALQLEEIWILLRAPGGLKAGKTVAHAHLQLIPRKEGLITWNYQEIMIPPIDLAEKLRKSL